MAKELTYFLRLMFKMTSTLTGRCHAINSNSYRTNNFLILLIPMIRMW